MKFEGNLRLVLEKTIALCGYFMKRKILSFLLILVLGFKKTEAQDFANSKLLFAEAGKSEKPVLLIFSGSDWCMPCIKLKKKVLADSLFLKFSREKLLVYTADFPQKRKLSQEQVADNEQLASRFNAKGQFPYVVLLRPDQTILGLLEVAGANSENWIKSINTLIASP